MAIPDIYLLPGAISELFVQATQFDEITLADRYGLLAAILANSLSDEERLAVDRLLRAVIRKQVRLSQKISSLG